MDLFEVEPLYTYAELQEFFPIESYEYLPLLLTKEWHDKRRIILRRDNGKCTVCGREQTMTMNAGDALFKAGHFKGQDFWESLKSLMPSRTYIDTPLEIVKAGRMVNLQVHHKYYVVGKLPWQCGDDCLVTLCAEHHATEQEKTIPVYADETLTVKFEGKKCHRCGGSGHLPKYGHVLNGICFRCWGSGLEMK